MSLLARHGVREYWLVDPGEVRIEVYALDGDQFRLTCAATGAEVVRSPLVAALAFRPFDVIPAASRQPEAIEER
jgi:Uma2 family endonuclease